MRKSGIRAGQPYSWRGTLYSPLLEYMILTRTYIGTVATTAMGITSILSPGFAYALLKDLYKQTRGRIGISEEEKLREDLMKEMRRMYPKILYLYYYQRLSDPLLTFWTQECEVASGSIDLLTEDEQDYLKALFRNLRKANEEVENHVGIASDEDIQCLQVNEKNLHGKLLNALNVVEREMGKEETGPEDYHIPEPRFQDAQHRLG
jgi:hypothetical protein